MEKCKSFRIRRKFQRFHVNFASQKRSYDIKSNDKDNKSPERQPQNI